MWVAMTADLTAVKMVAKKVVVMADLTADS